jgi:hypothetical protein
MESNFHRRLCSVLIIAIGTTFLASCRKNTNPVHEINGTETGQCLTPTAKIRVLQAGHDAGEVLPDACVFAATNSTEIRVYAWVWKESLSFSNQNATFAVDENIRAGANGTLIGRLRQGTTAFVLDNDVKTSWALLKVVMTGDGTKLAIGKGERTRTTTYPGPGLLDRLLPFSEIGIAFIAIPLILGFQLLIRVFPRIRRFLSGQ